MTKRRRIVLVIGLGAIAAVGVLVALGCGGGESSPDPYTAAANRLCHEAALRVAQAKRRYQQASGRPDLQSLADSMWPAAGRLHTDLGELPPPTEGVGELVEFEAAAYDAEGALIRVAQLEVPSQAELRAAAVESDAAAAEVQHRAKSAGLDACGRLSFALR